MNNTDKILKTVNNLDLRQNSYFFFFFFFFT